MLNSNERKTYLDDPGDVLLGDKKICNSWKRIMMIIVVVRINLKSGHAWVSNPQNFWRDFSIWWPENNNLRIQKNCFITLVHIQSTIDTHRWEVNHHQQQEMIKRNFNWIKFFTQKTGKYFSCEGSSV